MTDDHDTSPPPTDGAEPLVVPVEPDSAEALAKRYRLLVELSPDAICVHEGGVVVYVNPAGLRLARAQSIDQMVGHWITEFVHPDSIPGMLERLASLGEEDNATEPAEALMLLTDGTTKLAEIVSVRTEWQGRPAFQVIMRDISTKKAAEDALKYQAALVDHVSDAVIAISADGVIQAWNPAAEKVYGTSASHALGRDLTDVIGAAFSPREALALGGAIESVHRHRDGAIRNIRVSVTAMGAGYVLLCADLTAARRAIELFGTVVSELTEAVLVLNPGGYIEMANPASATLLGLDPSTVPGAHLSSLPVVFPNDDIRTLVEHMRQTGDGFTGKLATRTDGEHRWLSVTCKAFDVDLDEPRAIASYTDITQQVVDAEQQRHRASHDSLTGLLNHDGLLQQLDTQLASIDEPRSSINVHFLDLDRFKIINDSLGHSYGDQVLRVVAGRLAAAAGPGSSVGRIGGDEFSIVSPGAASPVSARAQAEQLLAAITASPIDTGISSVRMTASVGSVSTTDGENRTGGDLLRDADIALYYAKQSGRARTAVFDVRLRREFQFRQQLEQDLRSAIAAPGNGQLSNRYELIYDTTTGRVVGTEAKLCWHHPVHEEIEPSTFNPLADHIGLGDALGSLNLTTALSDLNDAFDYRTSELTLALTLSPRQFCDDRLAHRVATALAESGILPDDLQINVTENTFAADEYSEGIRPLEQLRRLRELGVEVAIDNFGAGHCSLAQLQQVDAIKIAPAFIRDLTTSHFADTVVQSIVAIARAADMTVVATGVETATQLEAVAAAGCQHAQGPYLHSPESATAAAARLH
ncbi:PAS domain S-box-containing protein/diguanylate cyclase (GGDEF)-like protein [Williamsia limnetica]|uniref:PAS domain S-box-containing protein/diguanylate cyclase (GGDEF)-like protein n=1 Tax=Williamsia limnetica TaxID=882452 RepID=A0A318RIQ5_WILLI|nr:EAL domain-containing protein [Williamsia limnetica]PYE17431.1 PAS domain S-box-containing protein/diguanylate cyclase (GGDEF)-like protein [Williamsia limnetica]